MVCQCRGAVAMAKRPFGYHFAGAAEWILAEPELSYQVVSCQVARSWDKKLGPLPSKNSLK
jgi:hypothetical protein